MRRRCRPAADVLNAGQRSPSWWAPARWRDAHEVIEVATCLGGGVAKALLGKAVVPDDLPFVTGAIGLLGTEPSWDLMQGCDTLLMVGTSFPYSEFLPQGGPGARGADRPGQPPPRPALSDRGEPGGRQPRHAAGAAAAVAAPKTRPPGARRSIEDVARWWRVLEARAHERGDAGEPAARVLGTVAAPARPRGPHLRLGSAANWYARDVKLRQGMKASLSGGLATMGPAVPYAIAAKHVHPDRPVVHWWATAPCR
jgi:pyruvate dehydrogenase (quinone)